MKRKLSSQRKKWTKPLKKILSNVTENREESVVV